VAARRAGCVVLVGVADGCRLAGAVPQQRLRGRDLLTRRQVEPRLVILGDEALAHHSPRVVAAWLAGHACPVVLWREGASLASLVPWIQAGFTNVAEARGVQPMVDALLCGSPARFTRCDVPPLAWFRAEGHCPPAPRGERAPRDGRAEIILAAVGEMRCLHDVEELAAALGWSRWTLARACRGPFGMTPGQVLRRHVRWQLDAARERGIGLDEVARALGYRSAAALWRVRRDGR
jgi:AraC-like DNA-binding protein